MSIEFKVVFPQNDPPTDGSRAGLCQYITYDFFFSKLILHNLFSSNQEKSVFFIPIDDPLNPLEHEHISSHGKSIKFLSHVKGLK